MFYLMFISLYLHGCLDAADIARVAGAQVDAQEYVGRDWWEPVLLVKTRHSDEQKDNPN